jgi:hypothetical protein
MQVAPTDAAEGDTKHDLVGSRRRFGDILEVWPAIDPKYNSAHLVSVPPRPILVGGSLSS